MPGARGLASITPFVLAGLLVQGGFRLLIRPGKAAALAGAASEAARLRARLGEEEDPAASGSRAEEEARIADELARVRDRVAALGGILARGEEAEAVLHSLASLAAEEGVRFRRFAPGAETRLDSYTAREASIAAEGWFFDFLDFFERLSLLPQLVLVEEMEFEASPDGLLRSRFVAVTLRDASEPAVASEAGTGR